MHDIMALEHHVYRKRGKAYMCHRLTDSEKHDAQIEKELYHTGLQEG